MTFQPWFPFISVYLMPRCSFRSTRILMIQLLPPVLQVGISQQSPLDTAALEVMILRK